MYLVFGEDQLTVQDLPHRWPLPGEGWCHSPDKVSLENNQTRYLMHYFGKLFTFVTQNFDIDHYLFAPLGTYVNNTVYYIEKVHMGYLDQYKKKYFYCSYYKKKLTWSDQLCRNSWSSSLSFLSLSIQWNFSISVWNVWNISNNITPRLYTSLCKK